MDDRYVMGIEIGGTNVSVVVGNEKGLLEGSKVREDVNYRSDSYFSAQVFRMTSEAINRVHLREQDIETYGVGAAGQPTQDGRIVGAANCPFEQTFPRLFGKKMIVRNDVAVAAYAARKIGYGYTMFENQKSPRYDAAMVRGTGLNMQVLMDGELIRSWDGKTSEFGHIDLNGEGASLDCFCGANGCAETYISGSGIARRAALRMGNTGYFDYAILKAMRKDFPGKNDSELIHILSSGQGARYVTDLADLGNPEVDMEIAVPVMEESSRNLVRYFGNIINAMPFLPYIEVYGGVAEHHRHYVDSAVEILKNDKSIRRNYKFDKIPFIGIINVRNLGLEGTVFMALHELKKEK